MNTGRPETNYGFWFPGPGNDGAAGSAFIREVYGTNWFGKAQKRGAWIYGGEVSKNGKTFLVVPRDGLRKRFHAVFGKDSLHLILDRDGFAAEKPVKISRSLDEISFVLENRTGDSHKTTLTVTATPAGTFEVIQDGKLSSFPSRQRRGPRSSLGRCEGVERSPERPGVQPRADGDKLGGFRAARHGKDFEDPGRELNRHGASPLKPDESLEPE
jgi:hypothetical protein